jgi:hypothetical protein
MRLAANQLNDDLFTDVVLVLPFDTIPLAPLNIQLRRDDALDDRPSVLTYMLRKQLVTSGLVRLFKKGPQA